MFIKITFRSAIGTICHSFLIIVQNNILITIAVNIFNQTVQSWNFPVQCSSPSYTIVQSEHTNYTIQCYDWLFYRVQVQTHAKKLYDLKHEFVILCTHSFTRLYIKNGKQYRGSCFCELLLSVQMKHQHLILGTLYKLMLTITQVLHRGCGYIFIFCFLSTEMLKFNYFFFIFLYIRGRIFINSLWKPCHIALKSSRSIRKFHNQVMDQLNFTNCN